MPRVTIIPATINPVTRMPEMGRKKRKVAGYARVSTDKDEQFTSYEAQVDYYTRFIKSHADWEFVKVYTDEGISALGTKNRDGFNEMVEDALAGAIDLIVTKSVSRFARNTVDSLVTIRKLKAKGVEVYFEKENIYSLDNNGELMLTILSSMAQEESRSISENVTWGQRKRFADGKISLPYKQFLGYDRGEKKDDPPVINPGQAAIVRRIYRTFMEGKTAGAIARELTAEGVPTPAGKTNWQASTVSSILQNEKYRGSALLQKHYTVDFLTKRQKVNEGEIPQYYVEHSHEAIIDPDEWDTVQEEIRRRKQIGRSYSGKCVFSTKLICGDCGSRYGAKVWHSTDKYKTIVWQCNQKYDGEHEKCQTPALTEGEIKDRFIEAFNRIIVSKEAFLANCSYAKETLADTASLDAQIKKQWREKETVLELIKRCVEENPVMAIDPKEFNDRYIGYVERHDAVQAAIDKLQAEKKARLDKAKAIDRFARMLAARDSFLNEFDPFLWSAMVESATVMSGGEIRFRFCDGTEITE